VQVQKVRVRVTEERKVGLMGVEGLDAIVEATKGKGIEKII
jgi:hypothetical protein